MLTSTKETTSPRCGSMSNRPVFFLYMRVQVKEKAKFRFAFVLPFFILFAFVDVLDDIAQLIKLFTPRASIMMAKEGERSAAAWCESITGTVMDLLWELAMKSGPLDLVDVDIKDKDSSVLVKVLTR